MTSNFLSERRGREGGRERERGRKKLLVYYG
jgi:hypothetical protein